MSKVAAAASVRITIAAGKAAPTPPIGPALGAKGVKSMDFCKEFNARSQGLIVGTPCPTAIKINPDKTFKFRIKTPTVSYFLKKAAGVEKGTSGKGIKGKKAVVGKVGLKTVYEIAKVKQMDEHMKDEPLYGIAAKVVASAKSLGIEVVY